MLNWIVLNRTDYLHKMDLALNNLQRLICHKTQQAKSNQTKSNAQIKFEIYHDSMEGNHVCLAVSLWCNGYRAGLRNRSKSVRTQVALLHSLSDIYLWESYWHPYNLSYGLDSITSRRRALALNSPQRLMCD